MPERATVTCPHCEQVISFRVTVTVAAEPPQRVRFETSDDLQHWLAASRLTISELRELPIYQAHPEQFEPLIESLIGKQTGPDAATEPTLEDALRPRLEPDATGGSEHRTPGPVSSAGLHQAGENDRTRPDKGSM